MPLILMCGPPCSGKSTRANQLKQCFMNEHPETRVIIVEDVIVAAIPRNALYGAQKSSVEKESRGSLRSEVQKTLRKDNVLILDAPNYIKGFRYELYCLSKGLKTTQCVVHCDIGLDAAWSFNVERDEGDRYERTTFESMFQRFESPESRNRWDSPLFVVRPDDNADDLAAAVYASLFGRKPPPPNQSTQCQPLSSTNFLYDLDRTTQQIVAEIIEAQKNLAAVLGSGPGMFEITLVSSDTKLKITQPLTPHQLARLRHQFIVYIKMRPVDDGRKIASMFVHYINGGQLTDP